MRKFKLMLSPEVGIEISAGWLDNLRRGNLAPLYRFLSALAVVALVCAAILFPLISLTAIPIYNYTGYLLLLVSFLIAVLLATIVLVGSRRLVDPPMFMPALIFVFIVLCGLLFAPANPRNTFGPDFAKYLGGLWAMVLLALYYLSSVFLNSARKIRIAKAALILGLAVAVLVQIYRGILGSDLFALSTLAIPVLILFGIETRKLVSLVACVLIAVAALVWGVKLTVGPEVWIVMILALTMTILTWLVIKNWKVSFVNLRADIVKLIKGKLDIFTVLHQYTMLGLVIDIVFFVVLVALWMLASHYQLGRWLQTLGQDYLNSFRSLNDIKVLLIGAGVSTNSRVSLMSAIIRYQGLLGIVAYGILALSSFYLALQSMTYDLKQKIESHWSLPFTFIIFAVPLYGLIASPAISLVIVWWASVGMLASKVLLNKNETNIYQVRQGWKIRHWKLDRFLPIWQTVLMILIFALWIYFATQISTWTVKGLI